MLDPSPPRAAKPDTALAQKHGLRYVHLPHGYDGINTRLQLRLAKAARALPGPLYVHCHHGTHRGPTAAAVVCLANQGWTPDQAEAWLVAAGTATNYAGLYETVRQFKKPTTEQLASIAINAANFPETSSVSGLVDAMVAIDERGDHLKAVRAAGYRISKQHPDLRPPHEAVILGEQFREAQRLPDSISKGADFIARLKAAEAEAKEAEQLLWLFAADTRPALRAQLDRTFDAMAQSCVACHRTYRDKGTPKASPQ